MCLEKHMVVIYLPFSVLAYEGLIPNSRLSIYIPVYHCWVSPA